MVMPPALLMPLRGGVRNPTAPTRMRPGGHLGGRQRFPRGLSGSRQMARERRCCTQNMPYGAPGNCSQRVLDRAGKPLDERVNEGRGLTEIFCGFAAGFRAELGNNELMDRIPLGDRHAYQDNSMGNSVGSGTRAQRIPQSCRLWDTPQVGVALRSRMALRLRAEHRGSSASIPSPKQLARRCPHTPYTRRIADYYGRAPIIVSASASLFIGSTNHTSSEI